MNIYRPLADLRCHNLTLPEAVDMAQNRFLWSAIRSLKSCIAETNELSDMTRAVRVHNSDISNARMERNWRTYWCHCEDKADSQTRQLPSHCQLYSNMSLSSCQHRPRQGTCQSHWVVLDSKHLDDNLHILTERLQ